MDKAIIFVVVSFCVNYFGLDVVLSTIRHLLKPSTIWNTLGSVLNFSRGLLTSGTKTETPQPVNEDATDFDLAAAKARGLDVGNDDVTATHLPQPNAALAHAKSEPHTKRLIECEPHQH